MRWFARMWRRTPMMAMDAVAMNEAEIDAVLLRLQLVIRSGDEDAAVAARAALDSFAAGLSDDGDAVGVAGQRGPPTGAADDALVRVRDAMAARCKLALLYRDGERQWSRRVVRPVALRLDARAATLAAWCETREDFRHFRLEHAEPLAERLPPTHRVLVAQYRAGEMARGW